MKAHYDTVSLVFEDDPPFSYMDKASGKPAGVGLDLTRALFEEAKIPYKFHLMPWRRAIREASDLPNTCALPANRIPSREKKFTWIGPLFSGELVFFATPSSGITISSIEELDKFSIVGRDTGPAVITLRETQPQARIVTAGSDIQAAKMLFAGRADLWLTGSMDGPFVARMAGYGDLLKVFPWKKTDLYIMCNKAFRPNFLKKLNQANRRIAAKKETILSDFKTTILKKRR